MKGTSSCSVFITSWRTSSLGSVMDSHPPLANKAGWKTHMNCCVGVKNKELCQMCDWKNKTGCKMRCDCKTYECELGLCFCRFQCRHQMWHTQNKNGKPLAIFASSVMDWWRSGIKICTVTKKKGCINMPAFYFYHNFYSVFLIMAHLLTSLNLCMYVICSVFFSCR